MDTKKIRAAAKAKRNRLNPETVAGLSVEITARLWRLPVLARCRRIACYLPVNAEVDCQFAAQIAWNFNREVYLPVIRGRALVFAPYRENCAFLRNRYGIPEPIVETDEIRQPQEIDVVLTPLVAFDNVGNRIGMGAGFYDRSFRFMQQRRNWTRPRLIGLAYEIQKVPQIKACSWDVPLQNVVTEKRTYTF